MSTDLVRIDPNQALARAVNEGGVGFEDTLIKPSFIELIHKSSTRLGVASGFDVEKGVDRELKVGDLYDVRSGRIYSEIRVVPLRLRKGRAKFIKGAGLKAKPECRSNDGIVPSPFVEFPKAKTCAECLYSKWNGKQKPECSDKWNLMFIQRETMLPRMMNISGTSISPLKALWTQMAEDMQMEKTLLMQDIQQGKKPEESKHKVLNLWDYSFTIKPVFVPQGNGGFSYHVLTFPSVKRVANPGEFGPLYQQYVLSVEARRYEQQMEQEMEAQFGSGNSQSETDPVVQV